LGVDLRRIAVDQDEVRPFARLEAADPVFGEAGIGRVAGEAAKGLLEAHPLLGAPTTRWLALQILPADRRGKAWEGIGAFDWEVGAERQPGSGLEDRGPSIGAFKPRRVEALFCHQPVAGLVGWLHRGDDAGSGHSRNVRRVDDLDMLDPPAAVAGVGLGKLFEGPDDLCIGGVADGVDSQLETHAGGFACLRAQFGVSEEAKADCVRLVCIGPLQPGPTRAQCPVRVEFDPAHA